MTDCAPGAAPGITNPVNKTELMLTGTEAAQKPALVRNLVAMPLWLGKKRLMQSTAAASGRSAFTITECLVVVATVTFILVIPCLAGNLNRERINRMACLNNLRQMGMGSQLYAAEDPKGRLAGNLPKTPTGPPGDDLNWLYGYGPSRARYVQDLKTFICPSTRNFISTHVVQVPWLSPSTMLFDLWDNAPSPSQPGHSYEVLSYWPMSPIREKTLQSTATYRKVRAPLAGTSPGPAMILLIFDAMDGSTSAALENYPNPYAGHGAEGGNMLFTDGHAEWIEVKDWAYRWVVSQDSTMTVP
jgi:prepilin-type processing-associated H-X9-DG protein